MGIVAAIPDLEAWLDADADSWSVLDDREYRSLVRRWSEDFMPLVESGAPCLRGHHATLALEGRLPAAVNLLSGFRVARFANMGGRGPSGYRAAALRRLNRDLANRLELIVAPDDLTWSC